MFKRRWKPARRNTGPRPEFLFCQTYIPKGNENATYLFDDPLFAALVLTLAGNAMAQEQVVKIGQTGPLSGPNAFAGKDNENGVRHH